MFHPLQPSSNLPALSAQFRMIGKPLATGLQAVQIALRLPDSPTLKRISANLEQVCFRQAGKPCARQSLTPSAANVQRFPYSCKDVAACCATAITRVNGSSQRPDPRVEFPLFPVQRAQRGANHFAGIVILPALHPPGYKAIQFLGKIHISRRHGPAPYSGSIAQLAKIANYRFVPAINPTNIRSNRSTSTPNCACTRRSAVFGFSASLHVSVFPYSGP